VGLPIKASVQQERPFWDSNVGVSVTKPSTYEIATPGGANKEKKKKNHAALAGIRVAVWFFIWLAIITAKSQNTSRLLLKHIL